MRVRHGRITFLFPLIGFLLLFGASTALGEVRPGSPLPLAYRGSTPVDTLKLNPAALDEIRYQIRLYKALESIAQEIERQLDAQAIEEDEEGYSNGVYNGQSDQEHDETEGSGELRIELEFQVFPDR